MGRNMYSINAEATPGPKAWEEGVVLAEQTLKDYLAKHGKYPEKVSYTFGRASLFPLRERPWLRQ